MTEKSYVSSVTTSEHVG